MGAIGATGTTTTGRPPGMPSATLPGTPPVTCAAAGEASAAPTTNEIDKVCFM
jgi:hypothetical protein